MKVREIIETSVGTMVKVYATTDGTSIRTKVNATTEAW